MIERDRRDVWWATPPQWWSNGARAMRLETKSSKQDRHSLKQTSAHALTGKVCSRVTKISSMSPWHRRRR